jgi:hypothetical protein
MRHIPASSPTLSALFAIILAAGALAKPAETIVGRVVGVHDGDTITLLTPDRTQVKIRLNGIDAPESGQAFGEKSKQALSAYSLHSTASLVKSISGFAQTTSSPCQSKLSDNSSILGNSQTRKWLIHCSGHLWLYCRTAELQIAPLHSGNKRCYHYFIHAADG